MDTLKLIIALYKKELADANELKLLYRAQLEQEQQRVQQLEAQSEEQLEEQFNEIKDELAKNGILINDEKVADWVKKNAKVNEVEVSLLSKDEIKAVNSAMIHLLQQKKVRDK